MEKLKLKYPLIVEGKCDKAFLSSFIDGIIIPVNGFGVFSDNKTKALLKEVSSEGIIILTDSDSAGLIIRNHIKSILPNKKIIQALTPQIRGKEKRKSSFSKEGFLGVEGIDRQIIIDVLVSCGATGDKKQYGNVSKYDLYELGIYGKDNSKSLRKTLLKKLDLPDNISTTMLLEIINNTDKYYTFCDYIRGK